MSPLRLHGVFLALAATLLTGCGEPEPKVPPQPITVSVITATPSAMALSEDLPGRVAALRVSEVRAQVGGVVQRRLFEQGSEVRAGQPLFQINAAPSRAELNMAAAALQRADATLARARVQLERLAPLVDADAISRQSYDDAVSLRDQASAEQAQAQALLERRRIDLAFTTIEAPISGRVDQALVTEGALVGSSDAIPMTRIQQIDQVYVDVRHPSSSLEALRRSLATGVAKDSGGLPVTVLRGDGTPYPVRARILFSGINVDTGTGDVLVRVLVDNPDRLLLPGLFVRTRFVLANYVDALSVPQQAVLRQGGKPSLWILDTQHRAHLVPVELGELIDRRYRVASGLVAGQKVVIEGIERLTEGAAVIPADWRDADIADATKR